jgi:predicted metalloprotease with PDZ domain
LSFNLTLPYKRGFSYFLKADALIRATSGGKRSLDDLVLDLYSRRRNYQYHGREVWLSLLEAELGERGMAGHDDMAAGKTVLPPSDCLGPAFTLVRQDKEPLEFGFDENSLTARVVSGLKAGSRAAGVGVRDGDGIVENTFMWQLMGDYEHRMKLKVRRGGEQIGFEYWPRSWEKVECWQWVESI